MASEPGGSPAPDEIAGDRPRRWSLLTLAGSFFLLRTASTITAVGLPLLVLWEFGIGLASGLVLAAELVPSVVLGSLIGELVVRIGAGRAAVIGAFAAAATASVVPLADHLWQLAPLVAVLGLSYSLGGAARMALRAEAVEAGAELAGNGLLITVNRVPALFGPALAALLAGLGFSWVFLTSAVAAAAAGLVLLRASFRPSASGTHLEARGVSGSHRSAGTRLRAAARFMLAGSLRSLLPTMRSDTVLAALTAHAMVWMFATGVSRILLPVVALHQFPDFAGLYGYLVVASAVGGVVGGLLAAPIARRAPGAVYFGLSLVDASCWAVVLTGGSPALMLALLLLAGISESITTAIFYAEVQARLGADRNGRFFAWLMPLSDLMTMAGLAIGGVVVRSGTGLATAVVVALLVLPVLALMRVWLNARLWQRATER